MYTIQSTDYTIEIGSLPESSLGLLLDKEFKKSKKIIIVDENTKKYCLEYLITTFSELSFAEVIELPSGEENKQIEICIQVWETLSEYNIDRKAIIINLGGGVISDMGGLIASLYKRGILFINIPTTLLSMVDASVGGKTGVDLGIFKNQIGLFSFPLAVYIDTCFLSTLDNNQIKNGLVEMIKHGLIHDKTHWEKIKEILITNGEITKDIITHSVSIKNNIVVSDPFEVNERKKLNFGHTIGHALESYFLEINKPTLHGFAVAAGIHIESYISFKMNLLSELDCNKVTEFISHFFPKLFFDKQDINKILSISKQDKKNQDNEIRMVLLKSIGDVVVDVPVLDELIEEGLKNYIDS
jgi:3-dehydroquinate synthase